MSPLERDLSCVARAVQRLEMALLDAHGQHVLDDPAGHHLAARTLLYAADALAFAIVRYRAEHLDTDHGPSLPF